jgi:hypothetical protein
MKNLPKSFIIFFSLIFFYFIISSLIYTLSSFALLKGKVFNFLIITEYQRNFYHQLGFRKIWQNQRDCIEYDKDFKGYILLCFNARIKNNKRSYLFNHGLYGSLAEVKELACWLIEERK